MRDEGNKCNIYNLGKYKETNTQNRRIVDETLDRDETKTIRVENRGQNFVVHAETKREGGVVAKNIFSWLRICTQVFISKANECETSLHKHT